MTEPLSTPEQVAERLGVTTLALIRFAKRHRVPLVEITRGVYRITPAAVLALHNKKGMEPPPPPPEPPALPPVVIVKPTPPRKPDIRHLAVVTKDDVISQAQEWAMLSAVYFLIRDGRVAYIGQSINVHQRLDEHRKKRPFERFFILPCEPQHLRALEEHYISEFRPDDNMDTASQNFRATKQNNHWSAVYLGDSDVY